MHQKCLNDARGFLRRITLNTLLCPGNTGLHAPKTGSRSLSPLPQWHLSAPATAPAPSTCAQTRPCPAESVRKQRETAVGKSGRDRPAVGLLWFDCAPACHRGPRGTGGSKFHLEFYSKSFSFPTTLPLLRETRKRAFCALAGRAQSRLVAAYYPLPSTPT